MCRVWAIGVGYHRDGRCGERPASSARTQASCHAVSYGDGSEATTAAFRPAGRGRARLAHNGSRSSGGNSLPVQRPPYVASDMDQRERGGLTSARSHTGFDYRCVLCHNAILSIR